jgi:hypothetical protein
MVFQFFAFALMTGLWQWSLLIIWEFEEDGNWKILTIWISMLHAGPNKPNQTSINKPWPLRWASLGPQKQVRCKK